MTRCDANAQRMRARGEGGVSPPRTPAFIGVASGARFDSANRTQAPDVEAGQAVNWPGPSLRPLRSGA
jgi:hypothetical protein